MHLCGSYGTIIRMKNYTIKYELESEPSELYSWNGEGANIGDALYKNIRYQHIPLGWITKSLTRLVTATLVQYDTEASTYCITQRVV